MNTATDKFVLEKLVPFREQVIQTLKTKNPILISMAENLLRGKQNKVGMKVLDNGKVAGIYTFHLEGIHITKTECETLQSEIHHPFLGLIKPYVEVEKSALEKMVSDENFLQEPFSAATKYLPSVALKFLA